MPIMLRSDKCVLARATEADMARLGECPIDPGIGADGSEVKGKRVREVVVNGPLVCPRREEPRY